MINRINIRSVATYTNPIEIIPHRINYFFGGNGSGKTTISKMLQDKSVLDDKSKIGWTSNEKEEVLVFNRFFIKENISSNLRGIFTMGEDSIAIQQEIDRINTEIEDNDRMLQSYRNSIKTLNDQIDVIKYEFQEKCWNVQKHYGKRFEKALVGFRGNARIFAQKCLECQDAFKDDTNLYTIEELMAEYEVTYGKKHEITPLLLNFPVEVTERFDNIPLLQESIIGSSHSQISELINKLNSSDWIKAGIVYARGSDGKCPYCQQPLSQHIQEEIENYFDDSYQEKCNEINTYYHDYQMLLDAVNIYKKQLPSALSLIDITTLLDQLEQLTTIIERNIMAIEQKKDTPSKIVRLTPINCYVNDICKTIAAANETINANNNLLQDESAKEKIKIKLWHFFVAELQGDILIYRRNISGRRRGLDEINDKISNLERENQSLKNRISDIEAQITSVKPTVNAINNILNSFGFVGFMLRENTDKQGTYKIVRPDGTEVNKTLSEGEFNFISFLYFYHLCFGSNNKSGINKNKVIVIDDPISSLDSSVLFIVSTLTKNILQKCRDGIDGIHQVFILTHNIYFHKEITFWGNGVTLSPEEVAYFVIRKKDNVSSVEYHNTNPIKNTYELMWHEIKNPNQYSSITIFNTMRRILEHYFNVIGGLNYEKCINSFDGQDKLVCKSLISIINDGSHTIYDDYTLSIPEESIDMYLLVFKKIFYNMEQSSHYEMMMK